MGKVHSLYLCKREKMEKTDEIFDLWNIKKKKLEKEVSKKIVKKRQIWLYYV